VTGSVEDDTRRFCAASVKAEEDVHASRSSFCRTLRRIECPPKRGRYTCHACETSG
jgi:hypothetical protein